MGGPIALQVVNRDYANWEERMNPWPVEAEVAEVHLPRPGHADLSAPGSTASPTCATCSSAPAPARPPPAWPAARLAKAFLRALGVEVRSHVVQIGSVQAPARDAPLRVEDFDGVDDDPVRCLDREASRAMVEHINVQRKANESLGGVFEVVAFGLTPGLGSHISWEERLDGRLPARCARSRRSRASRSATASTSPGARARRPTTRSSTATSAATTARPTTRAAWRAA